MDKGFVPGVHSQGSYVSVEEPTKGWVSLNPLPPSIDHKDQDWVTYYEILLDDAWYKLAGATHMSWVLNVAA